MRKEIKNDVWIKRVIKHNSDGTVDVELSTGVIGKVKWDLVNGRLEQRPATPKPKLNRGRRPR